jgi:hypothetical protein
MTAVVAWIEAVVSSIPLPILEVWGRFAYLVGLCLAVSAFCGFTFRIGEHWGFGRAWQRWDTKAFLSMPLTFVLIIATGYIGSFIVLVPGAQTFESLKDLTVLLSIVLLGYPALITVPFAYGLSDLIEGVPPEFLVAWLPGYFINPAAENSAKSVQGQNRQWPHLNGKSALPSEADIVRPSRQVRFVPILLRILKLGRLRLRGPRGAQDEFVLAAIAQNLRRLVSLVARPPPAQALCIV